MRDCSDNSDQECTFQCFIKHVYFSVSYQQATCQKYDLRYHKLPSRYGPLRQIFKLGIIKI